MTGRAAVGVLAFMTLAGCASHAANRSSHPAIEPRSPFESDTSVLGGILDGISAREVQGEVLVLPLLVERGDLRDYPADFDITTEQYHDREVNLAVISATGFEPDTLPWPGTCPGIPTAIPAPGLCPSAERTRLAVGIPIALEEHQRLESSERPPRVPALSADIVSRLTFNYESPYGSSVIVTDYYLNAQPGGGWVVVAKRIVAQAP